MVTKNGKIIGSELIGQKFDSTIYFWSRPSAIGYNPIPSGASNYGPTSDTLKKQVAARRNFFATKNLMTDLKAIPKEMIFASGSGLDPDISPESALLQIERVAKAINFNEAQKQELRQLITDVTEGPQFFLFGEPRINVFELNLAVDNIK
jgi:K+-transporting ATPase ATPase C chain